MGDSYEKVKESERLEAIRERAHIVVEMEKRFPKSHHYHRFMHFVEVADVVGRPQEVVWQGMARRVTEVTRTETSRLEGEMNTKIEELKGEMSELKNEMNKQNNKLDKILARLK